MPNIEDVSGQRAAIRARYATAALFSRLQKFHGKPVKPKRMKPPAPLEMLVPNIANIQRVICKHFKMTREQLLSDCRDAKTARPRQIGMYLARSMTDKSWSKIAHSFGRTDHSTSIWAFQRIPVLCKMDWKLAWDVAHIEGRFK